MSFYILAGLCIGFYITMNSVYTQISSARQTGIDNVFTNNVVLAIVINILLMLIIWPILVPYFFSTRFREALEAGFTKNIHAED